ncbi:DUF2575 family protein [Yersinia mollaretii ATCC 43969]|nr:DUF2575 family protein [Yersinia mollaretii ATCC 43969]
MKGANRGLTLTAVQGIIRRFPLFLSQLWSLFAVYIISGHATMVAC